MRTYQFILVTIKRLIDVFTAETMRALALEGCTNNFVSYFSFLSTLLFLIDLIAIFYAYDDHEVRFRPPLFSQIAELLLVYQ